jgi:hypothetical protein
METIKNLSEIAPQDLPALERVIGAPLDPTRHQAVAVRVLPVVPATTEPPAVGTLRAIVQRARRSWFGRRSIFEGHGSNTDETRICLICVSSVRISG